MPAIYDPATGLFNNGTDMTKGRDRHTATLLANGRILVVGGDLSFKNPGPPAVSSVEMYDPVNDIWSPAAPLATEWNYAIGPAKARPTITATTVASTG